MLCKRINAPSRMAAVIPNRIDPERLIIDWFSSAIADVLQDPIATEHQKERSKENSPTRELVQKSLGCRGSKTVGHEACSHDSDRVGDDCYRNHERSENMADPPPRRHQIAVSNRKGHQSHERPDSAASLHHLQRIVRHNQNIAISQYRYLS